MAENWGHKMARLKRERKAAQTREAMQRQSDVDRDATDDGGNLAEEREVFDQMVAPPAPAGLRYCIGCFEDKDIGEFVVWDERGGSTVSHRCYGCRKRGTPAEQRLRQPVRMQLPPQRPDGVW